MARIKDETRNRQEPEVPTFFEFGGKLRYLQQDPTLSTRSAERDLVHHHITFTMEKYENQWRIFDD